MKNLSILITFIVAIILVASCKKDKEPVIKYITYYVYQDSVYWPEATYINKTELVTYLDSVGDTTFFAAPTCSKLVFDREKNITLRYIGGHRNTGITCPIITEIPITPSENDTIYIVKDTAYITVPKEMSYAIFEATSGSDVFIDTALYNLDYYFTCYQTDLDTTDMYNPEFYLQVLNSYYWCVNPLCTIKQYPQTKLNQYLSVQSNERNKKIYMMDIYPEKWGRIDSSQLVFFSF